MSPMTELPQTFTTAYIVDHYELTFDGGDKANGSLYLATARGTHELDEQLDLLRQANLWSPYAAKHVSDDQRDAYKAGLIFVAAVAYALADGHFLATRFDHPKFPSDCDRWDAWLAILDSSYERHS